jgi:hypothetical protein
MITKGTKVKIAVDEDGAVDIELAKLNGTVGVIETVWDMSDVTEPREIMGEEDLPEDLANIVYDVTGDNPGLVEFYFSEDDLQVVGDEEEVSDTEEEEEEEDEDEDEDEDEEEASDTDEDEEEE